MQNRGSRGQPLRATPGSGNWMRDSSGMMAPVGGGNTAKMLLQLPKQEEQIAAAANTLVRGKFSRELWPCLSLLGTLGEGHYKTRVFLDNITAGSMAENGQASANFLQGIVQMLAPSAMPGDGHRTISPGFYKRGKNNERSMEDGVD